jgi:hypothetical protein
MEGIAMNLLGLTMSVYKEFQELKVRSRALLETPSSRISNYWMNSRQVMEALKIGKRKLQSLREHGDLPFSTVDPCWNPVM